MYFTALRSRRAALTTSLPEGAPARVPATVKVLGLVSLLTDISSEMLVAVVGYYLYFVLNQSTTTVGLLDGLYNGIPALLAIPAAYLADRFRRRKALAGLGYGLSAVTKLGFPVIGPSASGLGALLATDRFGKGIRSAPRDALISLATQSGIQARAFAVHRMLDNTGAALGPLSASAILLFAAELGGERRAFDAIFVISFCVAAVGLVVLWLYVPDDRTGAVAERGRATAPVSLLLRPWFLRTALAVPLLSAAWVSDTFIYLTLAHRMRLSASEYALLATGTMTAYIVFALPLGRLADRVGRWLVFVAGHLLLIAAYLLLAAPVGSAVLLVAALLLPGIAYAATDGVLMAYCGPRIPAELRTTGLALIQTVAAVGAFVSSLVFGIAWAHSDPRTVMLWFAAAMGVAIVLATLLVSPWRKTSDA